MKKKKLVAMLTAVAMVLSLAACGNTNNQENKAAEKTSTAASGESAQESTKSVANDTKDATADDSAADAAGKPVQTQPLVVHGNDFDAVIGDMFKEATGYDVEVVVGNGAETMSRIAAEKGNPQWDVVWIDSMYDVYNLAADGRNRLPTGSRKMPQT